MSSFDPMAAAIDWLDAYRAASLSILGLHADDASVECGCDGKIVVAGHAALEEYWRRRFVERPAGELVDLQPDGEAVVVTYQIPKGNVQAVLSFDPQGKIARCTCGPASSGPA